jgi:hypothetical protein
MAQISADILQRLVVAKHLLAENREQLTPNSDAAAVARMVLAAHDGAELAVAAIASHLNVHGLTDKLFLPDYAAKIAERTGKPVAGADYLKRLNRVRVGFKHDGVLPDARHWYLVVDDVWEKVDDWCREYLDVALDDIDLEQLLADADVKKSYETAKSEYREGRYREALEALGRGLYEQLRRFPGLTWPSVGRRNTEHALMLAAFGVRPSDYLALQQFLPSVNYSWKTDEMVLEWDTRNRGHEGNWTEANVRFCLDTFLDLALKVQYAPPVPSAVHFEMVFDDTITPTGDTAELFKWEFEPGRTLATVLTGDRKAKGRVVVKTLMSGETLRCRLMPATALDKTRADAAGSGLASLAKQEPTLDTADVLQILPPLGGGRDEPMYVETNAVWRGTAPRDDPFVRQYCPHLFRMT